jgi:hypothetical protein
MVFSVQNLLVIGLVLAFGAGGGLVNALLSGSVYLPRFDAEARVWKPGWVGNVVVGAAAAVALWGIYGPASQSVVVGTPGPASELTLRLNEMIGAMVSGIGGGRLLTAEVDKRVLAVANGQLETAKQRLADSVQELAATRADTEGPQSSL